ncbi:MAG: hypothetical protein ACOC2U_03565 [bacterium]
MKYLLKKFSYHDWFIFFYPNTYIKLERKKHMKKLYEKNRTKIEKTKEKIKIEKERIDVL